MVQKLFYAFCVVLYYLYQASVALYILGHLFFLELFLCLVDYRAQETYEVVMHVDELEFVVQLIQHFAFRTQFLGKILDAGKVFLHHFNFLGMVKKSIFRTVRGIESRFAYEF